MAAVAAGYRKGLISTGWPVLLFSCANGRRKRSLVAGQILVVALLTITLLDTDI